jgi:type II secretory pathway predicted ATPase ExeA
MDMYEPHFGLNKRPFRGSATGNDVFVGPNIAATMAGIKKALSSNDAIVTVSGPVGSGKTTLAMHALESISGDRVIVHVARMRLESEDVLDFLLDELGVQDKPRGTIQRFAVLRRKLQELEESKTRVFVAIEDSVRLGADALAEIEALTSADAGESEGASVILMGDDSLNTLLGEAQLARLQQRVRQRFAVEALSASDLHEYLQHCFRLAGGEFEKVFETTAAGVLHHLSGGIPRICNNLVESTMKAAADQNLDKVTSVLMSQVAENDYGLSIDNNGLNSPVEPQTKQASLTSLVAALPPQPVPLSEPPVEETDVVSAKAEAEDSSGEQEILELIQDTLPDLKTLAPEIAAKPEPAKAKVAIEPEPAKAKAAIEPEPTKAKVAKEPEPAKADVAKKPEPKPETVPEPVPEPPAELQLETESSADDVPAWDRDPTVDELKPDLDALEQAMAFAQGSSTETAAENDEPLPEPEPEAPEVIPEITLDNAINDRIENELIDKAGGEAGPPASEGAETPVAVAPQEQNKQSDAELQQMAADLSKAKSIEDIDDKLAETLFGEELNSIAAQFAIIPQSAEPANDSSEAVADEPVKKVPAVAPHVPQPDQKPASEAPKKIEDSGKPVTVSQRLRTVRTLNADSKPATPRPQVAPKPKVAPRNHLPNSDSSNTPGSFEDQINTSMADTQTQRVLNVVPREDDDDQGDEETKGGFFSRFKRS